MNNLTNNEFDKQTKSKIGKYACRYCWRYNLPYWDN